LGRPLPSAVRGERYGNGFAFAAIQTRSLVFRRGAGDAAHRVTVSPLGHLIHQTEVRAWRGCGHRQASWRPGEVSVAGIDGGGPCGQKFHDPGTLAAVGARLPAGRDTFEEVPAFIAKRLAWRIQNRRPNRRVVRAVVVVSRRLVVVENELLRRVRVAVVKDECRVVPDGDQALLFEGVESRGEHVTAEPVFERKVDV
jgi:hypothetical protein